MSSTTNYDKAIALIDSNSDLIKEKEKFERLFVSFLQKYRPYSSLKQGLYEPILNIKNIPIPNNS